MNEFKIDKKLVIEPTPLYLYCGMVIDNKRTLNTYKLISTIAISLGVPTLIGVVCLLCYYYL